MLFLLLSLFVSSSSYEIKIHHIEHRIAYISGISNINEISKESLNSLKNIYNDHPLLIFQDVKSPNPQDFIDFAACFDDYADYNAIYNPDDYPLQMLQPFDQFPDCKHVAPRGNYYIENWHGIKNLKLSVKIPFNTSYVWHTDLIGHEYKLPGCVTAFYFVKVPSIGGETDFISGERVYESLSNKEKNEAENTIIKYNRYRFACNKVQNSYEGVPNILDYTSEYKKYDTYSPLVFASGKKLNPCVLFSPSFCDSIVGKSQYESQLWINDFVHNKMLPHRVSVSWKSGDLALFNNRRFIHSSSPTQNYMNFNENYEKLLLQTFIPTSEPLYGKNPKCATNDMKRFISTTNYWNILKSDHLLNLTDNGKYLAAAKICLEKNRRGADPNPYFYEPY